VQRRKFSTPADVTVNQHGTTFAGNQLKLAGILGNVQPRVKLPRGKTTLDYSGGTHLHLDIDSWFDDDAHVRRFIELCWKYRGLLKSLAVKPRYSRRDMYGDKYATFGHLPHFSAYSPTFDGPDGPALNKKAMARRLLPVKYDFVTGHKAVDRGDLEFRFMHGTLNINTIIDWFKTIIGLVEKSKEGATAYTVPPEVKSRALKLRTSEMPSGVPSRANRKRFTEPRSGPRLWQ